MMEPVSVHTQYERTWYNNITAQSNHNEVGCEQVHVDIPPHSDAFLVEADMLANLNHPNIVRMLGVVTSQPAGDNTGDCNGGAATGVSDPVVGIVTEFVGNGTLGQVVRSPSGRLSTRLCARIALQVNEVVSSSTSPSRRWRWRWRWTIAHTGDWRMY
ncbi:hypothetical protein VaNZ11_006047 [Volvox africanus]|uniref:WWE domain-containing protein n=1 Tax=Volvox africanus TaxID=51714 RepID=A0ABQ5S147_9CHLO|nr:hypothetical protein VaNZ11_006047 [Volvox africanus]